MRFDPTATPSPSKTPKVPITSIESFAELVNRLKTRRAHRKSCFGSRVLLKRTTSQPVTSLADTATRLSGETSSESVSRDTVDSDKKPIDDGATSRSLEQSAKISSGIETRLGGFKCQEASVNGNSSSSSENFNSDTGSCDTCAEDSSSLILGETSSTLPPVRKIKNLSEFLELGRKSMSPPISPHKSLSNSTKSSEILESSSNDLKKDKSSCDEGLNLDIKCNDSNTHSSKNISSIVSESASVEIDHNNTTKSHSNAVGKVDSNSNTNLGCEVTHVANERRCFSESDSSTLHHLNEDDEINVEVFDSTNHKMANGYRHQDSKSSNGSNDTSVSIAEEAGITQKKVNSSGYSAVSTVEVREGINKSSSWSSSPSSMYEKSLSDLSKLPSPLEFGVGNPFLMICCVTLLLLQRDHIVTRNLDHNDLAMHFDKMVRKHDVRLVLKLARNRYRQYMDAHRDVPIEMPDRKC